MFQFEKQNIMIGDDIDLKKTNTKNLADISNGHCAVQQLAWQFC